MAEKTAKNTGNLKNTRKSALPAGVSVTVGDLKGSKETHARNIGGLDLISRYLVALVSAAGLSFLVLESLWESYSIWAMLLQTLFYTTAFFIAFSSLKGLLIGSSMAVGGLFLYSAVTRLSVINLLMGGSVHIYNRVMRVIDALGFISSGQIELSSENAVGGVTVIVLIASLLTCLCIRKRSLFIIYTVAVGFIVCPVYYYGMATTLADSAALICGLCGFFAVRVSEKHSRDRISSGVSGLVGLILAAAIMVTSVATVKTPWKRYDSFAPYAELLVQIFNDLSEGKPVNLGWGTTIPDPEEPRTALKSPRLYFGQTMMKVYSYADTPIYLRTWVGGEYKDDSWFPVSYNGASSVYVSTKLPYDPLSDMIKAYAEAGIDVVSLTGLRSTTLNINLETESSVIPLPAIARTIYNSDGYKLKNNVTVDGVFDYRSYKGLYSADTMVRYWKNDDTSRELEKLIYGYVQFMQVSSGKADKSVPYSNYCKLLLERNSRNVLQSIRESYGYYSDYVENTYGSFRNSVRDKAVSRAILEMFKTTDIGRYFRSEFVNRGDIPEEGYVDALDGSVFVHGENGKVIHYYLDALSISKIEKIADAVAGFLSERCRYDLNPERGTGSAMEDFLFETREGYCVQFATAGALILRQLGFNARYAEGYVATDFVKNRAQKVAGTFRADVYDRNAHAWTEVWVDGYGWMQLEMTPAYYNVFNPTVDTGNTTTEEPTTDITDTTEPPTDTSETEPPTDTTETAPVTGSTSGGSNTEGPVTTSDRGGDGPDVGKYVGEAVKAFGTALLVIIPIAGVIYLIIMVGKRRKNARLRLKNAVFGSENAPEIERIAIGQTLTRELSAVLRIYGFTPLRGELPKDFGLRLDRELEKLGLPVLPSAAVEATVSQVYGSGMSSKELMTVMNVTEGLRLNARRELGLPKYLINKIKGIL